MAPVLSPKKSVEGLIGGIVGAGIFGVVFGILFNNYVEHMNYAPALKNTFACVILTMNSFIKSCCMGEEK